jgi:hypothetical protein
MVSIRRGDIYWVDFGPVTSSAPMEPGEHCEQYRIIESAGAVPELNTIALELH